MGNFPDQCCRLSYRVQVTDVFGGAVLVEVMRQAVQMLDEVIEHFVVDCLSRVALGNLADGRQRVAVCSVAEVFGIDLLEKLTRRR